MRTLHSAFSALLAASTALAGIAIASGCETDDSSTPLPPAVTDATTDHAGDGAGGGGDAASDAPSAVESSTDAPAESTADGGTTGD